MRALLTHAWLFLGKWLGRLLLLLLAVGLGGWAIGSLYYAWKFSGPVSAEEQIAPDEARITQAIIQDAIRVVEQHRDNTRVLRDAHAKAHGCVKAEFKVRADLDPTLRRGVFAEAGKSLERLGALLQWQRLPAVRQQERRARHGHQAARRARRKTPARPRP